MSPEGVVLALLGLVVLTGLLIWMNVAIVRRNRRVYAEHPEKQPYGPRLLLRASPFVAIVLAAVVYGIVEGDVKWIVLGAFGTICFGIEIVRRWHRPTA